VAFLSAKKIVMAGQAKRDPATQYAARQREKKED